MTTFRFRLLALTAVGLLSGACDNSADRRREESPPKSVQATHEAHEETAKPTPLALTAMKSAVLLEQQNPDAWRIKYLNKRYHVIGKLASITGTTQSEPDSTMFGYSGPVFRVSLEPWKLPPSKFPFDFLGPELSFIDLPQPVRTGMRPGQQIDANCILTSNRLTFAYCQLDSTSHK